MKRRWILQLATMIMAMALFVLTVNTCSAEKDVYSVVGMGTVINEVPILLDISSPTVVTMDDENDIISIIASPKRKYLYLLTDILRRSTDSAFLGATFAAVDPNGGKYIINMRMYVDDTIQLSIMDIEGHAGFVLLLDEPKEHKGIQTRNDIIRRSIISGLR